MFIYLRKVSEFQARLAALVASGATIARREDIGCVEFTWRVLRAQAGLRRHDAETGVVTDATREWAANVQTNLSLRKTKPRPIDAVRRKLRRAQKAGLL